MTMPLDESHPDYPLTRFISEFLESCIADGMPWPIYLVTIAANQTVYVTQYQESDSGTGLDVQDVCERIVEPGFGLPISMTAISPATGQGASCRIEHGKEGATLMVRH